MVSFEEQEFLVTSVLSVDITGVVGLDEVVALAVPEKGWDETFLHVVDGIELVYVEVSPRLDAGSNHSLGNVDEEGGNGGVLLSKFVNNSVQVGERRVEDHACDGRVSLRVEQRSGSSHASAPEPDGGDPPLFSQMVDDDSQVFSFPPAKTDVVAL